MMPEVPEIDVPEARELHASEGAVFLDARDPQSHSQAAIPGSLHLSQESFDEFVSETAKEQPIVVYCYHGNSSRMVTEMLMEQGFTNVQSMMGGFERWASADV